jgi:hypothetical protein
MMEYRTCVTYLTGRYGLSMVPTCSYYHPKVFADRAAASCNAWLGSFEPE